MVLPEPSLKYSHTAVVFIQDTSNRDGQMFFPFLTRELRACARASYRYDVGNGIRSLARLVDSCKPFFRF